VQYFSLPACVPDFPLPLHSFPPETAPIHRPVAITRLLKSNRQNLSDWGTIRRLRSGFDSFRIGSHPGQSEDERKAIFRN
jgi:hypothetical protein